MGAATHYGAPNRGCFSIRWNPIAALALLATAGAATATPAQDAQDRQAAYKALTGADLDPARPPPVALAAWPGGPPDLRAVATLEDADADGEPGPLGTVRVGLVTRRGAGLALVASDEDADHPEPERNITPSVPDIDIDQATFRIAPAEFALGVDVEETLSTTSTEAGAATLILYRRLASRLVPIFSAQTDDFTLDKTAPNGRRQATRHIVRFTSHLTRGFYDLVLTRPGARAGRTFAWAGTRYRETRK